MHLRLANMDDLPQLKVVYREIINNMNNENIEIWDDIYPCEFFYNDIENNCLYVLVENDEIVSAFALCNSNAGADCVKWKNERDKVLYIDRFGVNVNYLRKGIGSIMLNKAISLAKEKGAEYLRLFVVDINEPAINLYIKNGFERAEGIYDEVIDDDFVLHEFGFEIKTSNILSM
ncbi:MAG: GNAT family N-acetyltransferase [Clostridium butyricum]|nr:GNAT family N-acetyltransferase [Clostridium butyricum]